MSTLDGMTLAEAREAYRTLLKLRRIADPDCEPNTYYGRWVAGGGSGVAPARPESGHGSFGRITSSLAQATVARVRAYVRNVLPGALVWRHPGYSVLTTALIVVCDDGRVVFNGPIGHNQSVVDRLWVPLSEYSLRRAMRRCVKTS